MVIPALILLRRLPGKAAKLIIPQNGAINTHKDGASESCQSPGVAARCWCVPFHPKAGRCQVGLDWSTGGRGQHQWWFGTFPRQVPLKHQLFWRSPSLAKLASRSDTARCRLDSPPCTAPRHGVMVARLALQGVPGQLFCPSWWLQSPGLAGGSGGTTLCRVSLCCSPCWSIRNLAAYCLMSG